MPKHRIKLHRQKLAVARACQMLKKVYPIKIMNKNFTDDGRQITQEMAAAHLEALDEVTVTLDGLCKNNDMREDQ